MKAGIYGLFGCLVMAMATPSQAQPAARVYYAPAPWLIIQSSSYQAPDGSYDSYTDFSRALWGMPCGIECTRRHQESWGLAPPQRLPYAR